MGTDEHSLGMKPVKILVINHVIGQHSIQEEQQAYFTFYHFKMTAFKFAQLLTSAPGNPAGPMEPGGPRCP